MSLTVDVVAARGSGFSVEAPEGRRFLIRSTLMDWPVQTGFAQQNSKMLRPDGAQIRGFVRALHIQTAIGNPQFGWLSGATSHTPKVFTGTPPDDGTVTFLLAAGVL
jgi:hypothetical protein